MRTLFRSLAAICALVLPIVVGDAAYAQRRVALVVGNSGYQHAVRLDNPANDANAVAELFRKAGFDVVTSKTDLGVIEFKRALREFVNTTRNADIAVVYYAGHGIEVGGINYLVPVDAKLANDLDAEDEAVDIDRVVRSLDPARRLRLVILDACRDNPFSKKMQRTIATRAITSGLGKIEPTSSDTLIAYAAKAGSTAEDGTGQNSPFTTALLNNLAEPGLDVRIAFGRVRDEVLKKTGNRQEPFVYGSLGGATVSLVPAPEPKKVEVSATDIRNDYELAERVGTPAAWDSFLSLHGSGFYAELARAQRAKLLGSVPPAPAPSAAGRDTAVAALPAKPAEKPERATPDRIAWDKIQDSPNPADLRNFLKRYPSSPLAVPAQHRLELLEQAALQRRQEELERQKIEREAARQRQDEESRAKAAAEDKTPRETALRPEAEKAPDKEAAANTPELLRSAQKELRRIGCYGGRDSGTLDSPTRRAIEEYRSKRGQPGADVKVTDAFVSELKEQAAIESCIATREPSKPEPTATRRERPKAEDKREARPARETPPRARAQAAAPARPAGRSGGGASMTGVGF
jgi:hypothetical protein